MMNQQLSRDLGSSSQSNSDMDGNQILRSRIEEQSTLIVSLKTRNDQLLAKINSAESQNLKLIEQQNLLQEELNKDAHRFKVLEDRFNELADHNKEIIKIKDEYKVSLEKLTLENANLRNQLNAKESQKIVDFYNQIEGLNKELENERQLSANQKTENTKIRAELAELQEKFGKVTAEFTDLTATHEKTIADHKSEKEVLVKDLTATKTALKACKVEVKTLVESNFSRAQMIEALNSENKLKNEAISSLKFEIQKLKDKWKNEIDKVDSNYRIKCLLDEIAGFKNRISQLDLHRDQLKNQLSSEKLLNERLRSYE